MPGSEEIVLLPDAGPLPDNCRKVSTRAFLIFLEEKGWIASAAAVEREAIKNGRQFSLLRFPNP